MTKPRLTTRLEVKALGEREFEGHGSIFGNVDLGGDVVVKGAFKRSLAAHAKGGTTYPPLLWMHDPTRVAGKWHEIREGKDGLEVRGELAATPLGEELHELLKMDAVSGLSIGYQVMDADYDDDGNRLLKEIDLWEISLVSMPMNPLATVTHAKSRLSEAGEYVPLPREFERILRDAGCSRKVAKTLLSRIFDAEDLRDADDPPRDATETVDSEADALQKLADHFMAAAIQSKLRG
jgi:HK97 family phage prohead protease